MRLLRTPLRGVVLWRYRAHLRVRPRDAIRYLISGQELSNFTYEIENLDELLRLVAETLQTSLPCVKALATELLDDHTLRADLTAGAMAKRGMPWEFHPGRRIAWYCAVRIARPSLVVETGTRDGFGTAILARAVERNAADGAEGHVMTFDLADGCGWLVPARLRRWVTIITGDSRETLGATLEGKEVDILIHDSHHEYEHEWLEFEAAYVNRSPRLILISDNAHATTALRDFAAERGGTYSYCAERPRGHFYPGGGVGLARFEPE